MAAAIQEKTAPGPRRTYGGQESMQAGKITATTSRQDSRSGAGYRLPCLSMAAAIPAGTGCNIPITRAGTIAPAADHAADHAAGAGARRAVPETERAAKRRSKTLSKIFC